MKRAATLLEKEHVFENLVNPTCVVHGAYRVAEEVREKFDEIDNIVADTQPIIVRWEHRSRQLVIMLNSYPKCSTRY